MKKVRFQNSCDNEIIIYEKHKRKTNYKKTFQHIILTKMWDSIEPTAKEMFESDLSQSEEIKIITYVLTNPEVPGDVKQAVVGHMSPSIKKEDWTCLTEKLAASRSWEVVPAVLKQGACKKKATKCTVATLFQPVRFFIIQKSLNGSDKSTSLLNYRDKQQNGCTPLHKAAISHSWPLLNVLLELGADVNIINDHGRTALMEALNWTRVPHNLVCKLITKHNVNNREHQFKGTALHKAVVDERWDIVQLLAEHSADVNLRDNRDLTPLDYAVHCRKKPNIEAFNMLISTKNVNKQDWMETVREGCRCHVTEGIEGYSSAGKTPLHHAVLSSTYSIVSSLIMNGAIVDMKDKSGHTALDYAIQKKAPQHVIALLKGEIHMANPNSPK